MAESCQKRKRTAVISAVFCILIVAMVYTPIIILIAHPMVAPIVRKQKIIHLVERNFNTIMEAFENEDLQTLAAINGIKEVDIVDRYVIVYCQGYGIVPSSQEYGFYYSRDNVPAAVFDGQIICGTSQLVQKGEGYEFIDRGYNVFYTEYIKGNIYFYKVSF